MSNRISRIDHIDIIVQDVDASVKFFTSVGFTPVKSNYNGSGVQLRFPGPDPQPILELCPVLSLKGEKRPLGLNHIALAVDILDAAGEDFAKVGLHYDAPPRQIASTGRRLTNLIDPDGRKLQFVENK